MVQGYNCFYPPNWICDSGIAESAGVARADNYDRFANGAGEPTLAGVQPGIFLRGTTAKTLPFLT